MKVIILFKNTYPSFQAGRILKSEMFENIRDYPRNIVDIYFKDCSNGIICGTNIKINENNIVVTKGIVKHSGKIYFLKNDFEIPYFKLGKETLVKIRFLDKGINESFKYYNTQIFIDDNIDIAQDEMELCRFKLSTSGKLNFEYKNFNKIFDEFDTVNIINQKYAAYKEETINPLILKCFIEDMKKSKKLDVNDICFFMNCINSHIVERETIIYYIKNKLNINREKYSNEDICNYLKRILNNNI